MVISFTLVFSQEEESLSKKGTIIMNYDTIMPETLVIMDSSTI